MTNETRRMAGWNARARIANGGAAAQCTDGIARAREERQREGLGNISPVVPAMQVGEAVGAHDPNEIGLFQLTREGEQGFCSVVGIGLALKIGHHKARMFCDELGQGKAIVVFAGLTWVFQWILRGHQPPDPIELQALHGIEGNHVVTVMGRIE